MPRFFGGSWCSKGEGEGDDVSTVVVGLSHRMRPSGKKSATAAATAAAATAAAEREVSCV